jgi:hypothetical protein
MAGYVTAFETHRGRESEFDKTEAGTAEISLITTDGRFDPTNATGPYYGQLDALKQSKINIQHPIAGTFHDVFTGYVEDWENRRYGQKHIETTVPLTDGFELLEQAQVPPSGVHTGGGGFYAAAHCDDRIYAALADGAWPAERTRIASGNVNLQAVTYPPGTSMLSIIQDAADGEFPGVANFFMTKEGWARFTGRYIRFQPDTYGIPKWRVGDAAACAIDPTLIPIFDMRWTRSKSLLYNTALVLPEGVAAADVPGNRVTNGVSVNKYGWRNRDIQGLLTLDGDDGKTGLAECKDFATYYVNNYSTPHDRVYDVEIHGHSVRADVWDLLLNIEIGHRLEVNTVHPGGGGFNAAEFYVEGIHNYASALNEKIPKWRSLFDLSPRAQWTTYPTL